MHCRLNCRWGVGLAIFLLFGQMFLPVGGAQASEGGANRVYLPLVQNGTPPKDVPAPQDNSWLSYANSYRSLAGVPPVTEDRTLDDNCYQHARYMAENNFMTHQQDASKPYASAAGQICAGHGNAWLGSATSIPWTYRAAFDGWMSSVPHRLWLLYPTTPTFGFGFYTASGTQAAAALDVLSKANFNADGAYPGWPIRYPAPGQARIPASAYPITLSWSYFGPTPTLSSFSVISSSGSRVSATANTSLEAGHKGIQILPSQALKANSVYTVSVSGSYNNAPFSYSWKFSTGTTAP